MRNRWWIVGALASALALLGGCTVTPVQAWEKGHLARPSMALEGRAAEAAMAEHIYASREAAAGRAGVGAAGCGCN